MEKKYVEVLTIPFLNTTRETLLNELDNRLANQEQTFIVTANPEIVEYANSHEIYKHIILGADMIVPDGIGIILASKIQGTPLKERVTGFDLLHDLLASADRNGYKVYFLGAEEEVIQTAAEKLSAAYPGMDLCGYHHGYIDIEDDKLAQSIAALEPDIIITALGFPRQELWINRYAKLFQKGLFIGVGGSFDVIAGKVKGAPAAWKKLNIEWLYRLIQQPSRWRRMLALPVFVLKVIFRKR